jgi:hypothetical protein
LTWNLVHFYFQLLVFRFSIFFYPSWLILDQFLFFAQLTWTFVHFYFRLHFFRFSHFLSPILDWIFLHLYFWIAIFHLGTFFVPKHSFCLFCSLLWLTLSNSCHDNWLCGLVMTTDYGISCHVG